MGLKTILDSIEDLPEEHRAFYVEDGDKFVLDLDGIDDHPKVRGLVTANRENVRKRDQYKAEVEGLKARIDGLPDDFDAEAYEALKQQAEGKEPPKTDEQVTRVREQLERKHKADLDKKDEEIAALRGTIGKVTIDDGLSKAMDDASIDPKHKAKLIPYLKAIGAIKLEEDGSNFQAVVETDMGPLSLAKFVQDWAASDDGKDYVAKPSGPDAKGNNGRGGTGEKNPWASDSHNLTRQGELVRTDPDKARQFMRAAGLSDSQISQRIGA
ncbi:hypothetical protein O9Z70_06380 [Devosia sp. YIM 151766]|uniref:hypothetical protein n=1 Tax=Devosia sp. YIM 151766 TaxID=3017325 RepID=UPI00255CA9A3|nr:hypothetical protein [Devosia sp. YIM 151766]WIY54144.1 hypothetical protein O9Z70_06380 [Devosia sp. YIM 151766]